MKGYIEYETWAERTKRMVLAKGATPNPGTKAFFEKASHKHMCQWILSEIAINGRSDGAFNLAMQLQHDLRTNGQIVYAPREIIEWINTCSFDFTNIPLPHNLHHTIAIHPQENSRFRNATIEPFCFSMGKEYLEQIEKSCRIANAGQHDIWVQITSINQKRIIPTEENPIQEPDLEIGFSQHDLCKLLSYPDYGDKYLSELNKGMKARYFMMNLDLSDLKKMMAHAALGAALMIYINAFPESLKYGPPDNKSSNPCKRVMTITAHKRITHEHGSPCAHWRKGHFRELRDERFKKNSDGSNRIVFVHASIVAAKGKEIYTVAE